MYEHGPSELVAVGSLYSRRSGFTPTYLSYTEPTYHDNRGAMTILVQSASPWLQADRPRGHGGPRHDPCQALGNLGCMLKNAKRGSLSGALHTPSV